MTALDVLGAPQQPPDTRQAYIAELEAENEALCIKLEKASATIAALRAEREPSAQRKADLACIRDGLRAWRNNWAAQNYVLPPQY